MVEGSVDLYAVFDDASLQLDERVDAAASGPGDPAVERFFASLALELECDPETLFEQVGAVKPRVGLRDPGQLLTLADGEVLRVLQPMWTST